MRHIPDKKLQYVINLFAEEDDLLKNTVERINKHTRPIQINAYEGKFLEFLIKLNNVKNIVEVGTLLGYSTLWMARATADDGHVYTLEKLPEIAEMAQETFDNSDVKDKITLLQGKAKASLKQLSAKAPFDMIFIDANKDGYEEYLDWAEQNIRKNGLIIGDNSFLFGAVYGDNNAENINQNTCENMHNFNKRLSDKSRYNSIMLTTEQGMTIAQKLF